MCNIVLGGEHMSTLSHDAVLILGYLKETIDAVLYCEYQEFILIIGMTNHVTDK